MEKENWMRPALIMAILLLAVTALTLRDQFSPIYSNVLRLAFSAEAQEDPQQHACNGNDQAEAAKQQHEKHLEKLRASRMWQRKVQAMEAFFNQTLTLASANGSDPSADAKILCIYAGIGHEVLALRRLGFKRAIGIDIVESLPLVIRGDAHRQPFSNGSFDMEFSAQFSNSLVPEIFAAEMERTLRPGGFVLLDTSVSADRVRRFFSASSVIALRSFSSIDGSPSHQILLRKNGVL